MGSMNLGLVGVEIFLCEAAPGAGVFNRDDGALIPSLE